jgi:hypothetical protein
LPNLLKRLLHGRYLAWMAGGEGFPFLTPYHLDDAIDYV